MLSSYISNRPVVRKGGLTIRVSGACGACKRWYFCCKQSWCAVVYENRSWSRESKTALTHVLCNPVCLGIPLYIIVNNSTICDLHSKKLFCASGGSSVLLAMSHSTCSEAVLLLHGCICLISMQRCRDLHCVFYTILTIVTMVTMTLLPKHLAQFLLLCWD